MSELNKIQAILEKYWEGESSIEEERQLKAYFASGTVDEQLRKYAPMFQAFREEQAVQLTKAKIVPIRPQMYWAAAASVAILLAVGAWWLFSKPDVAPIVADKALPLEQLDTAKMPAVVEPEIKAIAQAQPERPAHVVHPKKNIIKREKPQEINAEEEAAMEEIKAALALVSSKIRKGRQEAAKGAAHLESVDRIFKKKEG